jgi:SAM-dependent methyltransferase
MRSVQAYRAYQEDVLSEPKLLRGDAATTSLGHELSEASYLDSHFLTCQPEYETILRSVGIQPGWHVLDAGCGAGSFLPLLAELVGARGSIRALDLAPENVAIVQSRIDSGQFPCRVEVQTGSVTQLPYPDRTFDAVWSAAVAQYLTDQELRATLSEFRRVVRSGGLVAVKDWDPLGFQVQPTPPTMVSHVLEAFIRKAPNTALGSLRTIGYPAWLRAAGYVDIWRQSTLIERSAPLRPVERAFMATVLKANVSQLPDVPVEDLPVWRSLGEVNAPDHIFNQPDFYWREVHVLVVGRVP